MILYLETNGILELALAQERAANTGNIPLTADVIRASIDLSTALGLTEFDAMVCTSILDHAGMAADDKKAFLSYDHELLRVGGPDLRQAGITLFTDAGECFAFVQRFAAE